VTVRLALIVYVVTWAIVVWFSFKPVRGAKENNKALLLVSALPAFALLGTLRSVMFGEVLRTGPLLGAALNIAIVLGTGFDPLMVLGKPDPADVNESSLNSEVPPREPDESPRDTRGTASGERRRGASATSDGKEVQGAPQDSVGDTSSDENGVRYRLVGPAILLFIVFAVVVFAVWG